jgi:hypothetical protein
LELACERERARLELGECPSLLLLLLGFSLSAQFIGGCPLAREFR